MEKKLSRDDRQKLLLDVFLRDTYQFRTNFSWRFDILLLYHFDAIVAKLTEMFSSNIDVIEQSPEQAPECNKY